MKTLYVIDFWVPFPSSEYGGVFVVIAESDEEATLFLARYDDGYSTCDRASLAQARTRAIAAAQRFAVLADEPSRIVKEFTT